MSSPSGTFEYKYTNNPSDLVQRILFASGAYITNVYDGEGRMRETSLRNSGNSVLNSHKYGYNADSQRTVVTNTGGNYMDYIYDTIGQLKTATGKRANGTTRNHEAFGYHYDDRGNLERKTNNNFVQSFTLGAYNQLAGRSRSGTYTLRGMTSTNASSVTVSLNGGTASSATFYTEDNTFFRNFTLANGNNTFVASGSDANSRTSTDTVTAYLPSTGSFLYDLNGNLTNDQQRVFIYDQENQLTTVLVSNNWKSEFVYDGLGRRRIRKEFEWQNSAWFQSDEVRYIYDGKLVVEERDRFNNPRVTYTRGTDLSGSREEAGGIGGLLARFDHMSLQPALYHSDGSGNITAMVNTNQAIVAKYIYDPFGHVLGKSGPLAESNLYRFSSKEEHLRSGLVYYLYRYYDSILQRWTSRDRKGEFGFEIMRRSDRVTVPLGNNHHAFLNNTGPGHIDAFGLDIWVCTREVVGFPFVGNHAYLWDDKSKKPCGMNASSNKGPRGRPSQDKGPGSPGQDCARVPGSAGKESDVMACCDKTANNGMWAPAVNDCHNAVDDCLESNGLKAPPHPRVNLPQPPPNYYHGWR